MSVDFASGYQTCRRGLGFHTLPTPGNPHRSTKRDPKGPQGVRAEGLLHLLDEPLVDFYT